MVFGTRVLKELGTWTIWERECYYLLHVRLSTDIYGHIAFDIHVRTCT